MGAQSPFWIVGIHQLLGTQAVPIGFWVPMDSRVTPGYLLASGLLGILAPRGYLGPHQLLGTKHLLVPITPCMPGWILSSWLSIPRLLAPLHLCQAGIQQ